MNRPWSSLVEGDEGSYLPDSFVLTFHKHNSLRQYEPSSTSTLELHGQTLLMHKVSQGKAKNFAFWQTYHFNPLEFAAKI